MDGVYEGPKTPGTCRACGSGNLDLKWLREINEIPAIMSKDEWSALEPFPIQVICGDCGHTIEGSGENFTIDLNKSEITYGYIRMPE